MIKPLFFIFFLIHFTLAQGGKNSKRWLTLNGTEPLVIARGGYSGLFPESSQFAFEFVKSVSLPNVVLFCDLQLTKNGHGFCLSSLELQNSTNIASVFPNEQKSYNVNGQNVRGWFALDYTYDQLYQNVSLMQNIYSRTYVFDAQLPIFTVENAGKLSSQFWLNVQYALFYNQHKLDPALYVQKALEVTGINFISSPEISFLKSLNGKVNNTRTKLVFRFLEKDIIEPTTNLTYGSILENLSTVKSFASGILVPKEYIWPLSSDLYFEAAATTLVTDAHNQGLEIYASGFANDYPASYNYSYDPTAEYLQFIDNSQFSVDGLLTDFPSTASESIACLAHNKNATRPAKVAGPLIISHNGASGVYAGCTDLAYEQAINDGADIIDCSVQMSKDGVTFCLASPDLSVTTTAVPNFLSRSATIPEIQNQNGIFSFDLTWKEIQTLKPQLTSPYLKDDFKRNPAYKNNGEFMTLTSFLELAQTKAVTGIFINIQNAAYLASNKGLSVTDVVSIALRNAAFDKQHTQKVLIQSDDSQVLSKFKDSPSYQKVLLIDETISAAPSTTMDEIRKYADAVAVRRSSIIKSSNFFLDSFTSVVQNMHAANVSVYAFVFRNEFITLQYDFLSDPMVELATYIVGSGVDGVITEFPATASAYLRSQCSHLEDNDTPSYTILQANPGSLLAHVPHDDNAPTSATAPAPILSVADVVDPPLPSASNNASSSSASTPGPAAESSHSRGVKSVADNWVFLCLHFCCLVYSLWDHESDHYF